MSVLCIIPARGGSKRIARKNVRDFAGRPMFAHALNAAQRSGVFDHIHVSTEDDEISKLASEYGAPPSFPRDPQFADDVTPIRDVVRRDVEEFARRGRAFDIVVLIYATVPLLEPDQISKALSVFLQDTSCPLLAVAPGSTVLERFMAIKGDRLVPAVSADRFARRTQDLTPVYRDAGAFAIYAAETLRADTDGAAAMDFRPFVLPAHQAIDIDTEEDWRHAELIAAGLAALKE